MFGKTSNTLVGKVVKLLLLIYTDNTFCKGLGHAGIRSEEISGELSSKLKY